MNGKGEMHFLLEPVCFLTCLVQILSFETYKICHELTVEMRFYYAPSSVIMPVLAHLKFSISYDRSHPSNSFKQFNITICSSSFKQFNITICSSSFKQFNITICSSSFDIFNITSARHHLHHITPSNSQ